MYEILDSPENVFAIEVVGKLEKDDYEKVLVPAVQKMIDGPGEIRAVFVFGDRYEGLTAGATWADTKLYVGELLHRELSKWKRCAIVTELDWLRHSIAMFPLDDAGRGRGLRALEGAGSHRLDGRLSRTDGARRSQVSERLLPGGAPATA